MVVSYRSVHFIKSILFQGRFLSGGRTQGGGEIFRDKRILIYHFSVLVKKVYKLLEIIFEPRYFYFICKDILNIKYIHK